MIVFRRRHLWFIVSAMGFFMAYHRLFVEGPAWKGWLALFFAFWFILEGLGRINH